MQTTPKPGRARRLPVMAAPSPQRIAALHTIRDSLPGQSGARQRDRLLAALRQLGLVSTYEASRYLDLYDPRARKMDLCNAGHPVEKMWCLMPTESGNLHRIGAYYLDRGAAPQHIAAVATTPKHKKSSGKRTGNNP